MKSLSRFRFFFIAGLWLVLSSGAYGYTAGDYYGAGLQLYNAKNYSQAIQYFTAALGLEPNNTASLQGRANSYYSLGQYQDALNDYQKVQAIAPSDQLSQMIQSLQAKVGSVSPAAGSSSVPGAPAPGDSFNQGVALYQQKQYAAAIPDFQKAVQENPNDGNASYYLGASYLGLGDMKNADLNLEISNRKQPNPSVAAYVTQLKSQMTPEDQQWVDAQAAASSNVSAAGMSSPEKTKSFGIRLEPVISLVSLADFDADAQSRLKAAQEAQTESAPNETFTASVPTGFFGGGLEPVVKLGPSFEIGLPFAILPVGTVSETGQDNGDFGGNLSDVTTYDISAFSVGLNARYLISLGKDLQVSLAGGPLLVPISVNFSENESETSGAFSQTELQSGTFSSMAFGGQVQLGLDWHLGDTFVVSPTVGYQFASASGFTGTLSDTQTSSSGTPPAPTTNPGQLEYFTDSDGSSGIGFLKNGDTIPSGESGRPLQVDLGGVKAGIQISAFF